VRGRRGRERRESKGLPDGGRGVGERRHVGRGVRKEEKGKPLGQELQTRWDMARSGSGERHHTVQRKRWDSQREATVNRTRECTVNSTGETQ